MSELVSSEFSSACEGPDDGASLGSSLAVASTCTGVPGSTLAIASLSSVVATDDAVSSAYEMTGATVYSAITPAMTALATRLIRDLPFCILLLSPFSLFLLQPQHRSNKFFAVGERHNIACA